MIHELHDFFHAVQTSRNDAQRHLTILNDTKTALHLVSAFIDECKATATASPKDSLNVLSMTLRGLCNDLKSLRGQIPADIESQLSTKIKWVFNTRTVNDLLQKVEVRKSNLLVILGILGLQSQNEFQCKANEAQNALQRLQLTVDKGTDSFQTINDSILMLTAVARNGHDAQTRTLHDIKDAMTVERTMINSRLDTQVQTLQSIADMIPAERIGLGLMLDAQG